jgi:hypothetical protein
MTPQEIYTTLDSFVTAHPIWSAVIIVAVLFWLVFIIALIVNRKALIEELEWHN